ncbi:hypothetical protein E4656_04085 [Natronospirillum operosum]|uniref:Uncharacterized protein n=1 Tax=Natronospirillum operosum TaxID=2759953 RepID=A0A4Z0WEY7_9GAMM|nr:hypothetical protein [Natronospirillum operosum]TGG95600.1 hypothetical protein E4656_04085 [Natronospirillum operosum]
MNLSLLTSLPVMGALMVGATVVGIAWALVVILTSDDPLALILVPLIVAPFAVPLLLGTFLWLGHGWALMALRITLVLLMAWALFLDRAYALNLFVVLPLMNYVFVFYVAWLLLSFA